MTVFDQGNRGGSEERSDTAELRASVHDIRAHARRSGYTPEPPEPPVRRELDAAAATKVIGVAGVREAGAMQRQLRNIVRWVTGHNATHRRLRWNLAALWAAVVLIVVLLAPGSMLGAWYWAWATQPLDANVVPRPPAFPVELFEESAR